MRNKKCPSTVLLQLSTITNHDLFRCLSTVTTIGLNFRYNVHALHDTSKDNMLTIEPRSLCSANKELRAICIGTSICHRQNTFKITEND